MNKPEINRTVSGYQFVWPEERITLNVSHLRSASDGSLTAQIQPVLGKDARQFSAFKLNFNSKIGLKQHINEFSQKYTDWSPETWLSIFDTLSKEAQDLYSKGEDSEELLSTADIQRPQYILYPFVVRNLPNAIFGDPSAAKTQLSLLIAQLVGLPWHDNPLGLTTPSQPVKSLVLDWEGDRMTTNWLLKTLDNGMHTGLLSVEYRHCQQPLYRDIETICNLVDRVKAELIIIDSLGLAAGGDLNGTETALLLFEALRKIPATPLILAHNSKDPETRRKSIYGNQFFTAQMRNIWEIRKQQEPGSAELSIALFHRKPPPFSTLHKPLGYKFSYNDDHWIVAKEDPKTTAEFLEQMGTQSRILDALRTGAFSIPQLKELLNDVSEGSIRVTLSTLKKKSRVVSLSSGLWGLASDQS